MTGLQGRTVAFLVAPKGAEQVELTSPWEAVERAGGRPRLVSTKEGTVRAFKHLDPGDTFRVDAVVADVSAADFDALVLPGGVANPDFLRMDPRAVGLVRGFFDLRKPVAVICHGPWTLIEADAVRGRTLTSWPSLRTDLRNAGAHWVDRQVAVCHDGPNTLVSSRKPDDLQAFERTLVEEFARTPAHT
ncbi:type 1 glutamine amidotransferase domain-containing protein [Kitasatospora sp. DSM 101779]|uniref:type 1 glutamine amidotransferase domain-containing protein n=1 Tax=Kitasatospora sp. DSM 101779 TaxID=2853165 RepID=UPI0021D9AE6E|nr:type 1 glutamine amidotransferase domain-containing protein [Kitasatospora sp. DSM 101779]MCU7821250.1 type 1 glutamine amidotransferase [Kitasatospora sp. DSM 101779]